MAITISFNLFGFFEFFQIANFFSTFSIAELYSRATDDISWVFFGFYFIASTVISSELLCSEARETRTLLHKLETQEVDSKVVKSQFIWFIHIFANVFYHLLRFNIFHCKLIIDRQSIFLLDCLTMIGLLFIQ